MHWLSVAMSQLQVFDADGAHTSQLALHFFATTRLGAYYYVLSSLGMLTAATAVEAWGKRPRKAAAAVPAAPLLQ